jgi:hypothetical protein
LYQNLIFRCNFILDIQDGDNISFPKSSSFCGFIFPSAVDSPVCFPMLLCAVAESS